LRQSVREREQEYLERLTAQLERDLGLLKTEGPQIGVNQEGAVLEGEALLRQLRAAKATGRMVIKLDAVMDARTEYDIVAQAGDKLIIPQKPEEVTIIGEVYYPTSHLHVANQSRDDYVRLSGGITERGNKGATYVVRADGSVSPPGRWFNSDVDIEPGDTIIVPLKVDRISNLRLFTDISTILYQLAITAAALDVVGVF
jgi:polysaccharide biosynthesis/export protein